MTFTEGSEHTLTEISQLAGLPISTAHRLTSELASWRLLERTPDGRYRAGLPLRMMGSGDACAPALRERARASWRTSPASPDVARGWASSRNSRSPTSRSSPGRARSPVSCPRRRCPLHPTALGRALLAFAPASMVEMTILRGLRAYTPHTVTAPDRFRRALAVVRLTRVAVTRFELEATTCGVAVPVFGPGGELVAAIELTVPDLGRELQPVMAALSIAARSLSRELGGGRRRTPTRAEASTPRRRARVQSVG